MNFEYYKTVVRDKQDYYRFNHSLCVADEAKRLARLYGADADDMYLAGLLHDITKNDSEEQHLNYFKKFGIILTETERVSPQLWHGISGAAYVKNILNVENEDIVSSIRYHTTAKANMTLPEKIVYIADFTSADRKYPDVDVMRKLANDSLEKAMAYSLSFTIMDLLSKKRPIHTDTVEAYNQVYNIKE